MQLYAWFCLLGLASLAVTAPVDLVKSSQDEEVDLDKRIINGEQSTYKPYFALWLRYDNAAVEWFNGGCGASLITPDVILTASHCAARWHSNRLYPTPLQTIGFYIGAFDPWNTLGEHLNDGNPHRIVRPKELIMHPDYNQVYDHDIALYKLQEPVDYSFPPIRLAEKSDLDKINLYTPLKPSGDTVTAIGFGMANYPNKDKFYDEVLVLREVDTYLIDTHYCDTPYFFLDGIRIDEKHVCAGNYKSKTEGGKDSCNGDSGGPLMTSDDKQIGVVSFGVECASKKFPGVYASVPYHYEWIKMNACNHTDRPISFLCDGYDPVSGGQGNDGNTPPPDPNKPDTQPPTNDGNDGNDESKTVIFISEDKWNGGEIGGLEGADKKCQEEAETEGRHGTWRALLSDEQTDVKDRLGDIVSSVYTLTKEGEKKIHEGDFWGTVLTTQVHNAYGEIQQADKSNVWTGSLSTGAKSGFDCKSWTDKKAKGTAGNTGKKSGEWINKKINERCKEKRHLYCIGSTSHFGLNSRLQPFDPNSTPDVGYLVQSVPADPSIPTPGGVSPTTATIITLSAAVVGIVAVVAGVTFYRKRSFSHKVLKASPSSIGTSTTTLASVKSANDPSVY